MFTKTAVEATVATGLKILGGIAGGGALLGGYRGMRMRKDDVSTTNKFYRQTKSKPGVVASNTARGAFGAIGGAALGTMAGTAVGELAPSAWYGSPVSARVAYLLGSGLLGAHFATRKFSRGNAEEIRNIGR